MSNPPDDIVPLINRYKQHLEKATAGRVYHPSPDPNWRYPTVYSSDRVPPVVDKFTVFTDVLKKVAPQGEQIQLNTGINITDEDMRILKEKADMMDLEKYDRLFWTKICTNPDPIYQELMRQKDPGPFERREKAVSDQCDLQKEMALTLMGPLTKEKIALSLAMSDYPEFADILNLPPGPKYITDGEQAGMEKKNEDTMKRGFLSLYHMRRTKEIADVTGTALDAQKAAEQARTALMQKAKGKLTGGSGLYRPFGSTELFGLKFPTAPGARGAQAEGGDEKP